MPNFVYCRFLHPVSVRAIVPRFLYWANFCSPLKAFWDPNPTYPHKCLNTGLFLSIAGIINTATDVLCTLLPALIVFKLQMPFRKRVSVASLFLVGIFVNVASALRIYFLFYQYENHDAWNFMQSSICSNLEIGLGLVSCRQSISPNFD